MSAPKKLLVAVDGSENSERAIDYILEWAKAGLAGEIHLVNVQYAVPRAVSTFVGGKAVSGYQHEEGMKAVASATSKLDAANVAYKVHIGVGNPGETIAHFAKELGCDAIVMGTRGLGGAAGLLLGSVTRDVIAETEIPVTLIK
jgi:nucleotide-binding universal stress UspA family protein